MKRKLLIAAAFVATLGWLGSIAVRAQLSAPLGPYANLGFPVVSHSTTPVTLTGNEMLGMVVFSGAGLALPYTASAVDICTLFPFVGSSGAQGFEYDWYLKSTGAGGIQAIAPGTNSNVTLVGTGTVTTANVRHFKLVLNACPVPGTTSPTASVTLYSQEMTAF